MHKELYRIWVMYEDIDQFDIALHGLCDQTPKVIGVIDNVLYQYDIRLTEEDVLVLKLIFNDIHMMRIEYDEFDNAIFVRKI
jgi:hypothetical protein